MSQKKKKSEIIDNIILDIWYILIAFFYYRKLIASMYFKFYALKVKTYFKILYIYIIEFESLESISTYWTLHFWPYSL